MSNKIQGQMIINSVLVVIDDDAVIGPNVECKFVRQSEVPKDGKYFLVNNKGFQVRKESRLISGLVNAKSIDFLADPHKGNAPVLNIPKIPALQLMRAFHFFRKVFSEYKAEAELMIIYNRETQEYDFYCPTQNVSGGHVHYNLLESVGKLPKNYSMVGTIHSHCDFSAYHSGVDVDDEKDQDGLHITLGHVNKDEFSFSASLVFNGERRIIAPQNVIDGILCDNDSSDNELDEETISNMTDEEKENSDHWDYYTFQGAKKYYRTKRHFSTRRNYCSVDLDKEDSKLLKAYMNQINNEWFDRVESRKLYQGSSHYTSIGSDFENNVSYPRYGWDQTKQKVKDWWKGSKHDTDNEELFAERDDFSDKDLPDELLDELLNDDNIQE